MGLIGLLLLALVSADNNLRLNHIQVKGSHNSYHIRPDPYVAPLDYGFNLNIPQIILNNVRGLEFDIFVGDDYSFPVKHIPIYDTQSLCPNLKECLKQVKLGLDLAKLQYVGKQPLLFIWLEQKLDNFTTEIYDKIDDTILSVFRRSELFTPDDVRKPGKTLAQSVLAPSGSWPKLEDAAGKVVFLFDRNCTPYFQGAHANLQGRIVFPTASFADRHWSPNVVVTNIQGATGEGDFQQGFFNGQDVKTATQENYLVRALLASGLPKHNFPPFNISGQVFVMADLNKDNTVDTAEATSFIFNNQYPWGQIPVEVIGYLVTQVNAVCSTPWYYSINWDCALQVLATQNITLPAVDTIETIRHNNDAAINNGAHLIYSDFPYPTNVVYPQLFYVKFSPIDGQVQCNSITTQNVACNFLKINQKFVD